MNPIILIVIVGFVLNQMCNVYCTIKILYIKQSECKNEDFFIAYFHIRNYIIDVSLFVDKVGRFEGAEKEVAARARKGTILNPLVIKAYNLNWILNLIPFRATRVLN
jgi:hypothetical protein